MIGSCSPALRAMIMRGSLAAVALTGAMAGPAQARIFFSLGLPLFVPPVAVAPPAYYQPDYVPPGYAPPGYPPSGYPPSGYAPPAYAPQGYAPQGYAPPDNDYSYAPPPQNLAPPRGYGASGGYAPQDSYSPSTAGGASGYAQSCHAGAYVCPLVQDTPPGGSCGCPGHDGHRIRGQAD